MTVLLQKYVEHCIFISHHEEGSKVLLWVVGSPHTTLPTQNTCAIPKRHPTQPPLFSLVPPIPTHRHRTSLAPSSSLTTPVFPYHHFTLTQHQHIYLTYLVLYVKACLCVCVCLDFKTRAFHLWNSNAIQDCVVCVCFSGSLCVGFIHKTKRTVGLRFSSNPNVTTLRRVGFISRASCKTSKQIRPTHKHRVPPIHPKRVKSRS